MARTVIIAAGFVGYMILLIPYWLGFDLKKLAHSPLHDAAISTTYGRTVFAFMVSTVPLLIDTLLDFFQRFSSKSTNHYVLGRFIYALVSFISSVLLVINNIYPDSYIFTTDPVLSYLLVMYGLRIGTASALMYILASVSPNVCGVVLPLFITLYVVATNITRFYFLAFLDRPFQSSIIMLLFLFILIICIYIYWCIQLYRERKTWALYDYSTIMYMIIYLITYGGSFMTVGLRIQSRNLYSDGSSSTVTEISSTALSFLVSTVLMIIVPGRIARLEASNNLKTIMDTKKSYVRYISHELRTPMNTVFMGINLCMDGSDSSSNRSIQTTGRLEDILEEKIDQSRCMKISQKQDILKDTSVACYAAIAILNDLLLYDKVENDMMVLNKTKVPIAELVHESLKMFNIQYRHKKIELVIENGNLTKDKSSGTDEGPQIESSNYDSTGQNNSHEISTSKALEIHDDSVISDEDMLELDKAKIVQVIRNVMSNALKFTPEGGQIYVSMKYVDESSASSTTITSTSATDTIHNNLSTIHKKLPFLEQACHHLSALADILSCGLFSRNCVDTRTDHNLSTVDTTRHTGYFVLTIRDSGAGISEANQSKLFHNIIQFQPEILQQGGGSGLGLYITKSIIDKHHGKIDVYSAGEGQGTTFTIKLPMTRQHSTITASHHNKIQENDVTTVGMKKSPSIIELYQDLYSASQPSVRSDASYKSSSQQYSSRYNKKPVELTRNIAITSAVITNTHTLTMPGELSPGVNPHITNNILEPNVNRSDPWQERDIRVYEEIGSSKLFTSRTHDLSVFSEKSCFFGADVRDSHIVHINTGSSSDVSTHHYSHDSNVSNDVQGNYMYVEPIDTKTNDSHTHTHTQSFIDTPITNGIQMNENRMFLSTYMNHSTLNRNQIVNDVKRGHNNNIDDDDYVIEDIIQESWNPEEIEKDISVVMNSTTHTTSGITTGVMNTPTTAHSSSNATPTRSSITSIPSPLMSNHTNEHNVTLCTDNNIISDTLRTSHGATWQIEDRDSGIHLVKVMQTRSTPPRHPISGIAIQTHPPIIPSQTGIVDIVSSSEHKRDIHTCPSNSSTNNSHTTSTTERNIHIQTIDTCKSNESTPRRLHVLIVDDSSMNRKMMARLLSSVHYTYNEAGDGVEAVQIMTQSMKRHPYNRQLSDQVHDIGRQVSDIGASQTSIHQLDEKTLARPFDVILMDFMMPNMDGPTATAEIRKLGYTGLIYGVTGNAQQFDIDHFIEKGANKVFVKPLMLTDLTKELKSNLSL